MTVQLQTAPEVSEAIEVKNRQNSHTLRIILYLCMHLSEAFIIFFVTFYLY